MSGLLESVAKNVRLRRLFHPRQSILVAVSGGLDSMVMLHGLKALSLEQGWRLKVAHFNHRLRGRGSDADERLVRRVAQKLGLQVLNERADVRSFARERGLSLEMAARSLRHEFLARQARKLGCRSVALAHHADDQVELFFLRLLRGSGTEGLAGMKWSNPSPADASVLLARPLLDQPKSALHEYALAQRLSFREDESNALLDIQRNRIRHELLPLLRSNYQPALASVILRLMEVLGGEGELVREKAREELAKLRQLSSETGRSNNAYARLPLALQRQCLHMQLIESGVAPEFELIERLRTNPGKILAIGEGVMAIRDHSGLIRIERADEAGFQKAALQVELVGGAGEAPFGGVKFAWQIKRLHPKKPAWTGIVPARPLAPASAGMEVFDADGVGRRIYLRHWQPGDRFQPIGMVQAVKLQDIFTNAKVPRALRRRLVVAATEPGEVFWVEGLRISERFKLTEKSIRCLHWRWRRH